MDILTNIISIIASVLAIVVSVLSFRKSKNTEEKLENHINSSFKDSSITNSNVSTQSGNNNSFNGTVNK